jgi:hypothetical protein
MNSAVNQAHGQRDDVDDVLVAFWEWLRLQEARWRDGPDRKEFHFSPNIASGDPFLDAHRRPAVLQRPSIAWRVLRTVSWGFLFTVIVSAAVAWQSSDDTTKDLVRRWVDEVAGLGTVVHDEAPASAGAAIEPPSNTTDAAPKQGAALLQAAPANQATLASAAELLTGLQHRFETMGNDIAVAPSRRDGGCQAGANGPGHCNAADRPTEYNLVRFSAFVDDRPVRQKCAESCALGSTGRITFEGRPG